MSGSVTITIIVIGRVLIASSASTNTFWTAHVKAALPPLAPVAMQSPAMEGRLYRSLAENTKTSLNRPQSPRSSSPTTVSRTTANT